MRRQQDNLVWETSLCSTKMPHRISVLCSDYHRACPLSWMLKWWSNHFYESGKISVATWAIGLTSVPSINSWKTTMAVSKQAQQSSVLYLGHLSHLYLLSRQTGRICKLLLFLQVNQTGHERAAVLQHAAFFQETVIQETRHPAICCVALAEQPAPRNSELPHCLAL